MIWMTTCKWNWWNIVDSNLKDNNWCWWDTLLIDYGLKDNTQLKLMINLSNCFLPEGQHVNQIDDKPFWMDYDLKHNITLIWI